MTKVSFLIVYSLPNHLFGRRWEPLYYLKFVHRHFRSLIKFWAESRELALLNHENSANLGVPEPKSHKKHMFKFLSIIFLRGITMLLFVKRRQTRDIPESAVNENSTYLLLKRTVFVFQTLDNLMECLKLRFTLDAEPESALSVLMQPITQVIHQLHM